MFFRHGRFMLFGGRVGGEQLDQPLSNFDVIGIPTRAWSSHLFACYENCLPSCCVAFTCPCIMWGQVVTRAQIPLLIGIKNSIPGIRGKTGYGFFVDIFFWSVVLIVVFAVVATVVGGIPSIIRILMYILAIGLLIGFVYLVSHTRTAFREKYQLPGVFPAGAEFWSMIADCFIAIFFLPCSLAQMARHVFQYERMDPKLGLFLGDPSIIPPLPPLDEEHGGNFERPARADQAGLVWTYDQPHPDVRDNRGAAHRQEEILERQRNQMLNNPPVATAVPASAASAPIYKKDGTRA